MLGGGRMGHVLTRFHRAAWIAVPLLLGCSVALAASAAVLEVGNFSAAMPGETLPDGWTPLTFKKIEKHTVYSLIEDEGRVVVRAVSDRSSSGLTREIRIDPKEYPIVRWQWKVANVLRKGDVSKKEGDDYPARIYITFEYDSSRLGFFEKTKYEVARLFYGQYPPLGALNYIWANKAPVGTIVPNTYTEQVMMIVVDSGAQQLNTWLTHERNVYEDYKQAFGEEPPVISGVAIMTDTDNTQESTTAFFGDIIFKKQGSGG